MKIKVAIIEDLKEVAQMLSEIINNEEDMECFQVYYNAEDAMLFLAKNPADICIVDIGLPRANGLTAIKHLTSLCPSMQFCMFTMYDDDEKIFESIKNGAKGYLLKDEPPNKIVQCIRELHQGGSPMSHNIARRILSHFQQASTPTKENNLPISDREKELLTLLSKGLLYKEIASKLDITIGTVKQHIHNIYHKLHVSNKTEALNLFNKI